jgi:hypothetical protein
VEDGLVKIIVEFSESELAEIRRVTGISAIQAAVRRLLTDSLMIKRREEIAEKFISGEWGVELDGFESARRLDREKSRKHAEKWRR